MKSGITFILAVVLLLPPHVVETAECFIVKVKYLFGLPNEYTTRNQWLSCTYNTVPGQYNANIWVCAAHFTRTVSWTWERVAYNVNTRNGCEHYKVSNSNVARQSGASDSQLGMAWYHNSGFGTIPECNTSVSILNRYHRWQITSEFKTILIIIIKTDSYLNTFVSKCNKNYREHRLHLMLEKKNI